MRRLLRPARGGARALLMPLLLVLAAWAASSSRAMAQAPVPWPTDPGFFKPILAADTLQPVMDPNGDISPDNTDVSSNGHYKNRTVGNMPSVYVGHDGTYLYFRWFLSGNPLSKMSGTDAYQIDSRTSWVILLDVNADDAQDWALTVSKTNMVRVLAGIAGTSVRDAPLAPIKKLGADPNWVYEDGTDGVGYVRVVDLALPTQEPDPTGPHWQHYLDVRVPINWIPGMTPTTVFRPYMGTSTTDAHIGKDLMFDTTSMSFDDVAPTDPSGNPGALYDARDPAPASDAGAWTAGETVQLTGYGWPKGATLGVTIQDPGGAAVWTGSVPTDAAGSVPATDTWAMPAGAAAGVYRVLAGIGSGPQVQHDTFTVAKLLLPSLSMTKTAPASADAGGPLDYTLTVSNSGDGAATNVVIEDPIPSGTTFRVGSVNAFGFTVEYQVGGVYSAAAPATQDEADGVTALRFTVANLSAGASATATFGVTLSPTLAADSTVTNVATINYEGQAGPMPPQSPEAVTTIAAPSLSTSKTAELRDGTGAVPNPPRTTATTGDILVYTVTVTNTSAASAHNVVVVDRLPAGTALRVGSVNATLPAGLTAAVAYSNDGGATWIYTPVANPQGVDASANAVRWMLSGPLPSGAPNNTATFSLEVVVQPGIAGSAIVNNATADYTDGAGTDMTDAAGTVSTPLSAAGVSIEPPRSAQAKPGTSVTFAHTVGNLGVVPDTVNLTATAPAGWDVALYRDVNGDGQLDAGDTALLDTNADGVPDTGALGPGASLPILAVVQVPAGAGSGGNQITVTAQSELDGTKSASVADSLTVFLGPVLQVSKYIGAPGVTASTARPGETITYGLAVRNDGDGEATAVVVRDNLSAHLSYVAGSVRLNGAPVAPDAYDAASQTLTVPVGTVAPGATATVTFQATVR
ncbi:MAG: DUF11 domain-containing protein [Armatimonadetes bacterium]|nr:DUF11 domain-containing protein [Armatimonadota bacterium]